MKVLNEQEICAVFGGSKWTHARDQAEGELIGEFLDWAVGKIEEGAKSLWDWFTSLF